MREEQEAGGRGRRQEQEAGGRGRRQEQEAKGRALAVFVTVIRSRRDRMFIPSARLEFVTTNFMVLRCFRTRFSLVASTT